jgi:MYXO-CTERM domain-containing protein
VQAGTCVGCQSNADCSNPNLPICDTASHTCVPDPSQGADGGASSGGGGGGGDVDGGGTHHGIEWSNSSGCSAAPGAGGGAWEWLVVALGLGGLRRRRRAARG